VSAPVHDLVVVGSGPAGYTAAVYAARARLAPLVFEGSSYGGALMTTTDVENYPGFPDGVDGPGLMERMRTQAGRFGADLRARDVDAVRLDGPVKEVVADGEVHRARAVVLAMGPHRATSGCRGSRNCSAAVSRPARPATGSSSPAATSPSSVAGTRRWRRRSS